MVERGELGGSEQALPGRQEVEVAIGHFNGKGAVNAPLFLCELSATQPQLLHLLDEIVTTLQVSDVKFAAFAEGLR